MNRAAARSLVHPRELPGGPKWDVDDSGQGVHPHHELEEVAMHMLRHGQRCAREALLVAAFALSSCGGGSAGDARGLSEAGYLGAVKRGCVAARQIAERAVRANIVPVVYLRRAAEAAESIQPEFANVRPPARFTAAHRAWLRLGAKQLALIRTALARLRGGAAPYAVAALEASNRRLLQRSNEIANELGLPECVSKPVGP